MSAAKQTKNATQTNNFKLTRRGFLAAVGISVAGLAFQRISKAAEKKARPNILFIMVDDLGKEWISCCGAEDIETPNIDALAKTGMRFENAYSMPQCTPSRTTLLTGQYPWRTHSENRRVFYSSGWKMADKRFPCHARCDEKARLRRLVHVDRLRIRK